MSIRELLILLLIFAIVVVVLRGIFVAISGRKNKIKIALDKNIPEYDLDELELRELPSGGARQVERSLAQVMKSQGLNETASGQAKATPEAKAPPRKSTLKPARTNAFKNRDQQRPAVDTPAPEAATVASVADLDSAAAASAPEVTRTAAATTQPESSVLSEPVANSVDEEPIEEESETLSESQDKQDYQEEGFDLDRAEPMFIDDDEDWSEPESESEEDETTSTEDEPVTETPDWQAESHDDDDVLLSEAAADDLDGSDWDADQWEEKSWEEDNWDDEEEDNNVFLSDVSEPGSQSEDNSAEDPEPEPETVDIEPAEPELDAIELEESEVEAYEQEEFEQQAPEQQEPDQQEHGQQEPEQQEPGQELPYGETVLQEETVQEEAVQEERLQEVDFSLDESRSDPLLDDDQAESELIEEEFVQEEPSQPAHDDRDLDHLLDELLEENTAPAVVAPEHDEQVSDEGITDEASPEDNTQSDSLEYCEDEHVDSSEQYEDKEVSAAYVEDPLFDYSGDEEAEERDDVSHGHAGQQVHGHDSDDDQAPVADDEDDMLPDFDDELEAEAEPQPSDNDTFAAVDPDDDLDVLFDDEDRQRRQEAMEEIEEKEGRSRRWMSWAGEAFKRFGGSKDKTGEDKAAEQHLREEPDEPENNPLFDEPVSEPADSMAQHDEAGDEAETVQYAQEDSAQGGHWQEDHYQEDLSQEGQNQEGLGQEGQNQEGLGQEGLGQEAHYQEGLNQEDQSQQDPLQAEPMQQNTISYQEQQLSLDIETAEAEERDRDRYRDRRDRSAPQYQQQSAFDEDVADDSNELAENEPSEVLAINVLARQGRRFAGDELLQVLLSSGLRFGEMSIFHRHANGKNGPVLFSVANALNPGTFDLNEISEFTTPGVCFFMTLPNVASNNMLVYEQMLATARHVQQSLDAELKDDNRSVMTAQTMEHYRQRIRDFELQQLKNSHGRR